MVKLILPGSPEFNDPFAEAEPAKDDTSGVKQTAADSPTLLPVGAIDCCVQITDETGRDVSDDDEPEQADFTVEAYREVQVELGLDRAVLVQPEHYAFDNGDLVTALETLDLNPASEVRGCVRGIAALPSDFSDNHLLELVDTGCVGARFNMLPDEPLLDWNDLDRMAARLHEHGWLVQLDVDGAWFQEIEPRLREWTCPILLTNFGNFQTEPREFDPGMRAMLSLIDRGRTWMRGTISPELSRDGAPDFRDIEVQARTLIDWAPERMVWGLESGTLHEDDDKSLDPDHMTRLFRDWCGSSSQFERIVKENAEDLFRFDVI